jgi:hypothetical protein
MVTPIAIIALNSDADKTPDDSLVSNPHPRLADMFSGSIDD